MEDHIRATPYGILIRHIHHCQGHHVRYCDIVKFWNYDDVILWDEVKPSCNEVLSATSIFARRTWHHKVLFHQCWFGLILTKSYKQANVLTKVADFAQTKLKIGFVSSWWILQFLPSNWLKITSTARSASIWAWKCSACTNRFLIEFSVDSHGIPYVS